MIARTISCGAAADADVNGGRDATMAKVAQRALFVVPVLVIVVVDNSNGHCH